jgi:ferredoxin
MQIDPKRCVACGNCVAVCPMGAIYIDRTVNRAKVNADECVECYTCFRGMSMERLNPTLVRGIRRVLHLFRLRFDPEPDVCPTTAITPDELTWPRVVRRAFSDVTASHESTGVHGRGTEEVKTNDVTNRLGFGRIGLTVELGRPGIGVWFRDVQHVTTSLAAAKVAFEEKNPVSSLMTDRERGLLNPEILEEKVMSVIIECTAAEADIVDTLLLLRRISGEIPTIMAVGISVRCDERGQSPLEQVLREHGFEFNRAKTNIGIGRAELAVGAAV